MEIISIPKLLKTEFRTLAKVEQSEISISENCLLRNSQFHLHAYWMWHSAPTLGFRFIENDRDGRFNPEIARSLQIPEGKVWGKLQKGQTVTLPDGRKIDPIKEGIVGPKRPGLVIAYSGDTGDCVAIDAVATNADYFICEATFGDDQTELAQERGHLTSRLAAEIAKRNHVKNLYLTHYSSRYADIEPLLTQALEVFKPVIAASDLLDIPLKPNE